MVNPTTTSDNAIIEALQQSLETGFRILLAKYQEPVYWHIRRLVVEQDASQETFVRIFRSLHKYKGDSSFRGWIYRIATNEALRIISKRRQENVSLKSDSTGALQLFSDDNIDNGDAIAAKLQKAILTLPPKQQLAFNLRYYDELGFDEIAQIAESSASSIKTSYHIAKEKIIKFMNSND